MCVMSDGMTGVCVMSDGMTGVCVMSDGMTGVCVMYDGMAGVCVCPYKNRYVQNVCCIYFNYNAAYMQIAHKRDIAANCAYK